MKMSEQIAEIAKALAAAQVKMKPAEKDSVNPHFKSKHSSMCAIWDAAGPIMQEGICILQDAVTTDKGVSVETTLVHSSGQWFQFGPLVIPLSKIDAQAVGSAVSYCKRYALCSAVGIVSGDVDDDGEMAMQRNLNKNTGEVKKIDMITIDQIKTLGLFEMNQDQWEKVLAYYQVDRVEKLTFDQGTHAISTIMRKNEQKKSDDKGI